MKIYYVHVLECSDKSYYTGITSNLTKRVEEHQYGKHIVVTLINEDQLI